MLQAQARCHRIGQQKAVKVYRLITRNTYEREMFDRASLKLGLDKAVLQSMGPKDLNAVRPFCHIISNGNWETIYKHKHMRYVCSYWHKTTAYTD